MGIAILKNTLIPPNSPQSTILPSLKFEYNHDSESVTLAIHSEHKLVQFALEYIEVFWKKYNIERIKGYGHIQYAYKNDLHKLSSDNKEDRDIIKLASEGAVWIAEVHTNADRLIKNFIKPSKSMKIDPKFIPLMGFLQKGSRIELGIDEIDLGGFNLKPGDVPLPYVDILDVNAPTSVFAMKIKDTWDTLQQKNMPIIESAVDLLENYLLANVHISINTPHIFATLHAKTSGIKEIWTKIKSLEKPQYGAEATGVPSTEYLSMA